MKHVMTATLAALALSVLSACGDKPQEMGGGIKQDTAAFNGTGSSFVASGWKPGDKASWESHLKARMQNSQNDYSKVN